MGDLLLKNDKLFNLNEISIHFSAEIFEVLFTTGLSLAFIICVVFGVTLMRVLL